MLKPTHCFMPAGASLRKKLRSQISLMLKTNLSQRRHETDPVEDHPRNHSTVHFYLMLIYKRECFCQELHAVIKGQGLSFWF